MIEKIKCLLGRHDDKYLYSLKNSREQIFQCKTCKKYFVFNKFQNYGYRTKFEPYELVRVPHTGIGDLSDGYHTFNELYHHRAVLFRVICSCFPDLAWKSKRHHDGTMYNGMFIVGIQTPAGQATYHYDINPYWDMFRVKELPKAPEWDGHTPTQAIERIGKLTG